MTLNGDAVFKEKLRGGLENDTTNLVNFHVSSRQSENFVVLVLSKAYKALNEKVQKGYVS